MTPAETKTRRAQLRLDLQEIEQFIKVRHCNLLDGAQIINNVIAPVLRATAHACCNPLPNLSFDDEWSAEELQFRIKTFIDDMRDIKALHAKHQKLHKELQSTYIKS